jgi:hypothetical protein
LRSVADKIGKTIKRLFSLTPKEETKNEALG